MIPFASQRAGGQDLATHLSNAIDNERIEIAALRGAVADDLHGAFAEWEAQAVTLTRCRQYLCSLSINPDELQGRLSRAQYLDYIDRAEAALGLSGQPRAIIFHEKADASGRLREHCHVVWSRIDAAAGKAVNLSFFKDKLMTVTREFARDHGLRLPDGYERHEKEWQRSRQLSSYDAIKQKETGLSHAQRMAAVTEAWQRSDSGAAFVHALEEKGYRLALGRNGSRPVLVDLYGHVTALTRLIDDGKVRVRDVRAFLGPDYGPDKLPSVEQAQALSARQLSALEAFESARVQHEQSLALKAKQDSRRREVIGAWKQVRQKQHRERQALAQKHRAARRALKAQFTVEMRRVRRDRAQRRPKGLAAFLGRVTGIALAVRKLHRFRDRQRLAAHQAAMATLKREQEQERRALTATQALRAADSRRQVRALRQIEQREQQTLLQADRRAVRAQINARSEHMPPVKREARDEGRQGVPVRVQETREEAAREQEKRAESAPVNKERPRSALAQELRDAAQERRQRRLKDEFAKARDETGGDGRGDDGGAGGDGGPKARSEEPEATEERKSRRQRRKERKPREERRAEREKDKRQGGKRDKDREKPKRTRKRDRDLDRGM